MLVLTESTRCEFRTKLRLRSCVHIYSELAVHYSTRVDTTNFFVSLKTFVPCAANQSEIFWMGRRCSSGHFLADN